MSLRSGAFPFAGATRFTGKRGHFAGALKEGPSDGSDVCIIAQPCFPWLRQHAGS